MSQDYSTYSDYELIEIIRNSPKEAGLAFAEIYKRYSTDVNAYCKFMMRDKQKAEDIFQEVFLRFYRKITSDFENINIKAYLIKSTRNLCLNYFYRQKDFIPLENVDFGITQQNYEEKELFDVVIKTINLLDEKYREPFVLREIEGLSYSEIADLCNLTVTNAKTRVKRAREKLIELLEPFLKDYAK